MRARAGCGDRPLLDRDLHGPGNDLGGGARALRERLDQILGDGLDLIRRDRRLHVLHHAHHGVPALGRVADLEPVDVVTAATGLEHDLLAGALWKIRSRLLRQGRCGQGNEQSTRQNQRSCRHQLLPRNHSTPPTGFSPKARLAATAGLALRGFPHHTAASICLGRGMAKRSIPKPSILDKFEYLGAFGGERRWRSHDGKRLYTWDSLHVRSRCLTRGVGILAPWIR